MPGTEGTMLGSEIQNELNMFTALMEHVSLVGEPVTYACNDGSAGFDAIIAECVLSRGSIISAQVQGYQNRILASKPSATCCNFSPLVATGLLTIILYFAFAGLTYRPLSVCFVESRYCVLPGGSTAYIVQPASLPSPSFPVPL